MHFLKKIKIFFNFNSILVFLIQFKKRDILKLFRLFKIMNLPLKKRPLKNDWNF